jgi:hypothetical protein
MAEHDPFEQLTKEHQKQWKDFAKLMLWSIIGIAVVLLLMRAFIVNSTAVH